MYYKSTHWGFSVRFALGQRSAIGPKLLDPSMGFPGLCRGRTRPTFQMFRIFALFTERFMVSVRQLSAMGPRLCEWIGSIPSMPIALLFSVSLLFLSRCYT